MHGININSLLPMRSEPSERAEMVSQLIFGEHFTILQHKEKWAYIHSLIDSYEGWVDYKMITHISDDIAEWFNEAPLAVINHPIVSAFNETTEEKLLLPAGSLLPYYDVKKEVFSINETNFHVARECVNIPDCHIYSGNELVSIAYMFLNSPYLWGGRSALGIDCSGLVQTVFRICGISLPRDASQQVNIGSTVNFLQEARPGDVAFFENEEGHIIHVGILISNRTIIHASGKVKIETIDSQGIHNEDTGMYSHRLRIIKRII